MIDDIKEGKKTFRPSYEGWKPLNSSLGSFNVATFRPSYEGWKLGFVGDDDVPVLPFRPSYEGWKLTKEKARGFAEDLLDLPMRDGNFGLTVDEVAEEVLLDLPMRDGNAICTPGQERPSSF